MIRAVLDRTSVASITAVCSSALADALVSPELLKIVRDRNESNLDFIARRRSQMFDLAAKAVAEHHEMPEADARVYVERTFEASMSGLGNVQPLGRTHAVLS